MAFIRPDDRLDVLEDNNNCSGVGLQPALEKRFTGRHYRGNNNLGSMGLNC